MQLTTVKRIILDADTRARSLNLNGWAEAAAPLYETVLAALILAASDDEPLPGWERLVVALCDRNKRLIIDALDATPFEQMRRRVSCISDIPEISGFTSLQDISAVIASVINTGAPRYNAGDVRGCAALYWTALNLIAETPAVRGFPGYARAVAHIKPMVDLEAPAGPMTPSAIDAFAWELRHSLDEVARIAS
ncbi:MAG TPA: hypothetical protein VF812_10865 [Ktedonobacterales bacterium]